MTDPDPLPRVGRSLPEQVEIQEDKEDPRVEPLKAGADGQDLSRRSQPGDVTAAKRTEQAVWAGYPLSWGDEG